MGLWDTVKKKTVEVYHEAGDLVTDPGRMATAVGTIGLSEVGTAQKLVGSPGGGMPGTPDLPPPPDPNSEETAAKLLEAQKASRRARGRASTTLTGQSGVTGNARTASRTLIGS